MRGGVWYEGRSLVMSMNVFLWNIKLILHVWKEQCEVMETETE